MRVEEAQRIDAENESGGSAEESGRANSQRSGQPGGGFGRDEPPEPPIAELEGNNANGDRITNNREEVRVDEINVTARQEERAVNNQNRLVVPSRIRPGRRTNAHNRAISPAQQLINELFRADQNAAVQASGLPQPKSVNDLQAFTVPKDELSSALKINNTTCALTIRKDTVIVSRSRLEKEVFQLKRSKALVKYKFLNKFIQMALRSAVVITMGTTAFLGSLIWDSKLYFFVISLMTMLVGQISFLCYDIVSLKRYTNLTLDGMTTRVRLAQSCVFAVCVQSRTLSCSCAAR